MKLSLIAAIGENNELGKDNNLIWHLPGDLKFFKETTMGKTIAMGYNTYLSLPKKLPGRKYIVFTFKDRELDPDIEIFHDRETFLDSIKDREEEIFIIGGASIYKQFINDCENLYLTEVEATCKDADVYFPKFNKDEYTSELIRENEDKGIKYKHMVYRRK